MPFDLPHVVAGAPRALAARGVADRVGCVGGDFFASVPAGAMLAGQERAEDQWHDLLSTAGFTGIGIRETGTPLPVIHAAVAG